MPLNNPIAPSSLPTYAQPRFNYAHDANRHIYLPNGFTRNKSQAALGKAMSGASGAQATGGVCNVLCIGDSIMAGKPNALTSFPFQLQKFLAALGYAIGGTGNYSLSQLGDTLDSRWTLANGFGPTGTWLKSIVSGSTATFVSDISGTAVDVWTFGNSHSFTVTIDGGAPATYTPGGTAGHVEKYTATGLANTAHTVVLTTTATATVYILACSVYTPSYGVRVHNFGLGGTTTTLWLVPVGTSYSAASIVQGCVPMPDIVVIEVGVNDYAGSVSLATYAANMATLVAQYQALGADVYLVAQTMESTFTQATWEAWIAALYTVADAAGCGLYDSYAASGNYTVANANGLMYDNIHANAAVHWQTAKNVAAMIGAL